MSSQPAQPLRQRTFLVRVIASQSDGVQQFFVREARTDRKWLIDNHSALIALLTGTSPQHGPQLGANQDQRRSAV